MEVVIYILVLFISINTLLKLSFMKNLQVVLIGLLAGIFILLIYPYAVGQSRTEMESLLENPVVLGDISVLVTIESVIYIGFCFMGFKSDFSPKNKILNTVLKWYPGLLIFPVLFYLLAQAVFYFSGTDFLFIAGVLAGSVFVLILVLSLSLRKLIPENNFRLEIHFILSLFVATLGLVATSQGKIVHISKPETVDLFVLGRTFVLFISLFFIGWVWSRLKWKLKKNKNY